jgi:hypothetical protein
MSGIISPATLHGLLLLDEKAMKETFTVTDVVYGDDGGGGQVETVTTRTTKGYMYSQTGDEVDGDQMRSLGKHRIHVPVAFEVSATARITRDSTGRVYEVKYVFPLDTYPTSRMIGAEDD